jgi:release factor glutamine methyltransferase
VSDGGFAGLTVQAARRVLAARFRDEGLESPDLDARLLVGAALGLDLTGLAVQAARRVTPDEAAAIGSFARRRIAREPVARILGRKEFWGLDLLLSDATLVPRADTETVVEAALDILRHDHRIADKLRIADIGTGSGAILLALLSELPNATGIGTDISAAALATRHWSAAIMRRRLPVRSISSWPTRLISRPRTSQASIATCARTIRAAHWMAGPTDSTPIAFWCRRQRICLPPAARWWSRSDTARARQ